jgi:hypothetical protein
MSTPKPKRFFFHYHKAASRAAGRNVLTIHWQNACHSVNEIKCDPSIETHTQKRQPHCILRGFATNVIFEHRPDGTKVGHIIK